MYVLFMQIMNVWEVAVCVLGHSHFELP